MTPAMQSSKIHTQCNCPPPLRQVGGDHYCVVDFSQNRSNVDWWYFNGSTDVAIGGSQGFLFTSANESYTLKARLKQDVQNVSFKKMAYTITALYAPPWAQGEGFIQPNVGSYNTQCGTAWRYSCACPSACGQAQSTTKRVIIKELTNNPNFFNGTTFTYTQAQVKRASDNTWVNLTASAEMNIMFPNGGCERKVGVLHYGETASIVGIAIRATAINGTQILIDPLTFEDKQIVNITNVALTGPAIGLRTLISSIAANVSRTKGINYGDNSGGVGNPCTNPYYTEGGADTGTRTGSNAPILYDLDSIEIDRTVTKTISVGASTVTLTARFYKPCRAATISTELSWTYNNPGGLPCRIDNIITTGVEPIVSWEYSCGGKTYLYEIDHFGATESMALGYGGATCYVCISDTAAGGTDVKISSATRTVSSGSIRLYRTRTA